MHQLLVETLSHTSRAKEEAELKRLKDKQAARKEIRAEQDRFDFDF